MVLTILRIGFDGVSVFTGFHITMKLWNFLSKLKLHIHYLVAPRLALPIWACPTFGSWAASDQG